MNEASKLVVLGDAKTGGATDRPTGRVFEVPSSQQATGTPVANNGEDSSPSPSLKSRRRLGSRGLNALSQSLSDRDRGIVASVASLRLLSARQVERLHFHQSVAQGSALTRARSCRRVLERLVRDRLLVRLNRRVGGMRAGSASFIYATGPVGQRLVATGSARARQHEPGQVFVAHTLAVAEVFVTVTENARDSRFELLELASEPDCWRSFQDLSGATQTLKPDLFAAVASDDDEWRWFLEIDLGTEHAGAIRRKAQAYLSYLRTGREQVRHGLFPKVLWIAEDPQRAKHLTTWLSQLGASEAAQLFAVTTRTDLIDVLGGGE